MRANSAELVYTGKATQNRVIVYANMAGQGGVIGENRVVADDTIMRDMHISHDPIIVADTGNPGILNRAGVKRAKFANDIVIANVQSGWFTGIFFVLRLFAERNKLKNPIAKADARMTGDDGMRANLCAGPNFDVLANDGIGTDTDISA
jgi:hypothetical protein